MVFYRRERPVPERTPRERLDMLLRTFRTPDGFTVEGLVEDLPRADRIEKGRRFPVEKVIEDAVDIYLKAIDTLRRGGEAQRSAIRGASLDMLVLLAKQAIDLAKLVESRGKERADKAKAVDAAQQKVQAAFTRALTLREQARRVLASMAREDAAYQEAVRKAATAADDGGVAAAAMFSLAAIGRKLLKNNDPKAVQRARLHGLDEAYMASLEAVGEELRKGEAEIAKLSEENDGDEDILAEAGVTLHMMMHVVDAFSVAHEVESSVPLLAPVHTQRVMRRLSKLPPPPPPPAPAKKRQDAPLGPAQDFRGGDLGAGTSRRPRG